MKNKLVLLISLILIIMISISLESFAASMRLTINKTACNEGDNFTVTISGINGKVNIVGNSNVVLNLSGSQWVDGSLTINGTAKTEGTGSIRVVPIDVTTNSAEPEEVTAEATVSIKISKPAPEPEPTPEPEPVSTPEPAPTTPTTSTTKKNNTKNNKTTEKPKETENKVEEEQGTISEFGLTELYLYAIDENNEKKEIKLSPVFDLNNEEYTCEVDSNINKVEIIYEANEYKEFVKVKGLDNELQVGKNYIIININDEKGKEKEYKITINKKESLIEDTTKEEIIKEEKATIQISVFAFVILELGVVIVTVLITLYIVEIKNRNYKI